MLTDLDTTILGIEAQQWRFVGAKLQRIRDTGLSPTGYYQRLNTLLDTPEALAHDPVTVARLRRWRATNRARIAS
jgi:hypothetical protein